MQVLRLTQQTSQFSYAVNGYVSPAASGLPAANAPAGVFSCRDTRGGQRKFFTTHHPIDIVERDLGVCVNLFL